VDRKQGIVRSFNLEKNYGFIEHGGQGRDTRRFFYHGRNISPDGKGSKAHAFAVNTIVTFREARDETSGRERAVDVQGEWLDDDVDLDTYREISQFRSWASGHGFIQRPCGTQIHVSKAFVLSQYHDRLSEIHAFDYVYHGVGFDEEGRWCATQVELYSREDQEKLLRGEALEPVEEATAVTATANGLLSPENRKKTLRDLIRK
jgi:cold shock CspA family protein